MRKIVLMLMILSAVTAWGAPNNFLTIREMNGITTSNYPVQIGRPFLPGEIPNCSQPVIDAVPATNWQADVKQRWPDGSVKHAILSFLIPTLRSNAVVKVTFQNQPSCTNTPLSQAQMLAVDFDAQMELTNGVTHAASGRSMLANGHYAYWISGPVATTVILADHVNGSYDIGFKDRKYTALSAPVAASATSISVFAAGDVGTLPMPTTVKIGNELLSVTAAVGNSLTVVRGFGGTTATSHPSGTIVESLSQPTEYVTAPNDRYRSVRPIFIVTFWPTINKVRVRFIGEVVNTQSLQDQVYSLVLKAGLPLRPVYSKSTLSHPAGTRWTKVFWPGGPPSTVAIDHNLAYMSATAFVPNYDVGKVVSEAAVASAYKTWREAAKDLFDAGNWQKAMGTGGGRPDIGPYPTWTVRWLYTGDSRMREQAFGNADLAAAWPMHFREGDAAKFIDLAKSVPGIGRVLSISTRPSICLHPGCGLNYPYTAKEDKIDAVGPISDAGWLPDLAHQPDPFSPQYILTGDYFYFEEMAFWAAWSAARANGAGYNYSYGRGPTGAEGGLQYATGTTEIRGQAWAFRNRVQVAFVAPDDAPEKAYFKTLIDDAIAQWEGMRNISGTAFEGNANWNWGHTVGLSGFGPLGLPPLHQWERGSSSFVQDPLNPATSAEGVSTWEQNFLIYSLGRAKELGYATDSLLSWVGENLINQITNVDFNPYLAGAYRLPTVRKSDNQYFTSWAEMKSGYVVSNGLGNVQNATSFDPPGTFSNMLEDAEHGYPFIALAAASMIADQAIANENKGAEAWNWLARQTACAAALSSNPKWAIVPRVRSNNGVQPVFCSVASVNVTSTSATIQWTTDQASYSQVEFGLTAAYGSITPFGSDLANLHSVNLMGLAPGLLYHYRVKSKDTFDNESVSDDYTFRTPNQFGAPVLTSEELTLLSSEDGSLKVQPSSVVFTGTGGVTAVAGGLSETETVRLVVPEGVAVDWSASIITVSGGEWLSVSPPIGRAPASLRLRVNTGTMSPGIYESRLVVSFDAGFRALTVPVFLELLPSSGSIFQVSPPELNFTARAGGVPPSQPLIVSDIGTTILDWTADALSSSGWLRLSQSTGITPSQVDAQVDPAALPEGRYEGSIRVSSGPRTISVPVRLTVLPVAPPSVALEPASFFLDAVAGSSAIISRRLNISNEGSGSFFWRARVSPGNVPGWFSVSPPNGSGPSDLDLSINPVGLAPGQYRGTVDVSIEPESGAIREAEGYRDAGMTIVSCDFWSSGIT